MKNIQLEHDKACYQDMLGILSRTAKKRSRFICIRYYEDLIKIYLGMFLIFTISTFEMSRSCMSYQGLSSFASVVPLTRKVQLKSISI